MNHFIFDIQVRKKLTYLMVQNLFDEIVSILNLTVLKKDKYIFSNGGFTVFWLLAESHLSAHYRIEDNYLALDIYSCSSLENSEKKILALIEKIGVYQIVRLNRIT